MRKASFEGSPSNVCPNFVEAGPFKATQFQCYAAMLIKELCWYFVGGYGRIIIISNVGNIIFGNISQLVGGLLMT